jgi:hypothetical protein
VRAAVALVLIIIPSLGGCALFDADTPSRSCRTDLDCFVAQGEACYLATGECGPRPDAAPPDAVRPDADLPDADSTDAGEPDADLPDADTTDATTGGAL